MSEVDTSAWGAIDGIPTEIVQYLNRDRVNMQKFCDIVEKVVKNGWRLREERDEAKKIATWRRPAELQAGEIQRHVARKLNMLRAQDKGVFSIAFPAQLPLSCACIAYPPFASLTGEGPKRLAHALMQVQACEAAEQDAYAKAQKAINNAQVDAKKALLDREAWVAYAGHLQGRVRCCDSQRSYVRFAHSSTWSRWSRTSVGALQSRKRRTRTTSVPATFTALPAWSRI